MPERKEQSVEHNEGEEFSLMTPAQAQQAVRRARKLSPEEVSAGEVAFIQGVRVGGANYTISLHPTYDNTRNLSFNLTPPPVEHGIQRTTVALSRNGAPFGVYRIVTTPKGLIETGQLDPEGLRTTGEINLGRDPRQIAQTKLSIKTEQME